MFDRHLAIAAAKQMLLPLAMLMFVLEALALLLIIGVESFVLLLFALLGMIRRGCR